MGNPMTVSLRPIEIQLVMKLDEADLMLRLYIMQATYQSIVLVLNLATVIAAYHYIFNS